MNRTDRFNHIESFAFSDPGLVRRDNEDVCACLSRDGCFFVSDGMGGAAAGEVASQIVEEYISDAAADTAEDSPGSRKYTIQQALHRANRTIREYARAHSYAQMGATLALLLADSWDPAKAWICHVGDSRVYVLRNGELRQLTRDHTVGAELSGESSRGGAHIAPRLSHMLTRSVGVSGSILPEWDEVEVRPGDLFMICSDGVYTMMDAGEMQNILTGDGSLNEKTAALSARIREAGARDNYTIVLCRIANTLPEPEVRSEDEIDENAYLLKISEERIDHA